MILQVTTTGTKPGGPGSRTRESNPGRSASICEALLLYHSGVNLAYCGIGFYFKEIPHIKLKLPGVEPGGTGIRTRDVAL